MKVLNFGSLNLDYVYNVKRFVRPGETIAASGLNKFCGGKGLNQSIALAKSGVHCYHAGKVGKDGVMLIEKMKTSNIDVSLVKKVSGPTGHAVIQIDKSGQNCILLYGGANQQIDEKFIDEVLLGFDKGDILLLQNEINNISYILEQASLKGMKIVFNPSPFDSSILSYPLNLVTWFVLNEIEGAELTRKMHVNDITEELLKKYPESAIILTLGDKGVIYKEYKKMVIQDSFKVDVRDTTAAGDTFTGYFIAGIINNLEIEQVLLQASVAASIAVSREGAADSIPDFMEVNSRINLNK